MTVIKKKQISMVVMTVLAVAIAIASRFDYKFLNEPLLSMSPFLTMELEILLTVLVVVACPIGILIEKMATDSYRHFVGLHGALFALSGVEWVLLPVIVMQFFSGIPVDLKFSTIETIVALHIWFYITLLTYIAIVDIYKVTGRDRYYLVEHCKISNVWHVCGRVWSVCAAAVFIFFAIAIAIARVFAPICRSDD